MALHPENICDAVIESSKNRIVLHRKMRASAERNAQPKRIVPWLSAQCKNSAMIVGKLGEYFAIPIIAGFKLVRIKKFIIMGMVSPHEIMSFSLQAKAHGLGALPLKRVRLVGKRIL